MKLHKMHVKTGGGELTALFAAGIMLAAVSVQAGVCKIGSTEYDSLQEAFNAVPSMPTGDVTITLLQDVDVTSEIAIPNHRNRPCILDGDGHTVRQAYAGRIFTQENNFSVLTFKNVTFLGGGETHSTVSAGIQGSLLFLKGSSGPCSLTIDSGCIISNFVSYGSLVGTKNENGHWAKWNIYIKPGSVIACNSSTQSGGIIHIRRWNGDSGLKISGGDIFGNSAPNAVIAYIDAYATSDNVNCRSPENPILEISGGRIHDNIATSADGKGALFLCDYGVLDVQMSGGEIFDNDAVGFFINRGGAWLSRLHFSGGKVFGNARAAVFINQSASTACVLLSGDAVLASKYEGGAPGIFLANENSVPARVALEGDFSGFATVCGTYSSIYRQDGCVYGTNLNFYAGAENIHLANSTTQILQTASATGELIIRSPSMAKIGTEEYGTFGNALSAAADGDTITLLRDCIIHNTSIVPPSGKAITVDGAGYRIFRMGKVPLVKATTAGGNMTFTNVELNEGYFTCPDSYTNHVDGAIVQTADGVAATVTLGPGTVLSGGRGTNALVRVANGATVNLDGCVITGAVNRAVAASAGGTLGVKGATLVNDNAGGDIDVADGGILSMNGNLTGCIHVTVAGAEAFDGQRFGMKTGDWTGEENFFNGGTDPKLHVSKGDALVWCRRGFVLMFR